MRRWMLLAGVMGLGVAGRAQETPAPTVPAQAAPVEGTPQKGAAEQKGTAEQGDPSSSAVDPAEQEVLRNANGRPIGSNDVGSMPPKFSLTGDDGVKVTQKSLLGKPVLIDFWATWCPPCRESLPTMKKIRERTEALGLVMIGVDQDENKDDGPKYYRKQKFDWPDYHRDGSVSRAFPHHAIPTTVLLDADGKVLYFHTGGKEKGLIKAIARLGPEYEDAMKKM